MNALFAGLLAHFVGDYLIQSSWMANEKTKRWLPAWAHAFSYGIPFLLVTRSAVALLIIVGTHVVIDHYRLARHVVWAKNFLAPRSYWPESFAECKATGYSPSMPVWLSTWLMIIADNTLHVLINSAALYWL